MGCSPPESVCARCREEIQGTRGGLLAVDGADAAWAATAYEGAGRRLVGQLKFAGRLARPRAAAEAIARMAPAPAPGAAVVPVPADPLRSRMRGFDPASLIAAELATLLGLQPSDCLARSHSRRQVGRSRAERLAAGPTVWLVSEPPVHAVLVDDVTTTGTTLARCAAVLREGGCAEILAVAFARA